MRPVFESLREQLADYAPEATEAITGTAAKQVRALARAWRVRGPPRSSPSRTSRSSTTASRWSGAQILVFTLCGQFGKKGSGVNGFPAMNLAGMATAIISPGSLSPQAGALLDCRSHGAGTLSKAKLRGDTDEMFIYEAIREEYRSGGLPLRAPSSTWITEASRSSTGEPTAGIPI